MPLRLCKVSFHIILEKSFVSWAHIKSFRQGRLKKLVPGIFILYKARLSTKTKSVSSQTLMSLSKNKCAHTQLYVHVIRHFKSHIVFILCFYQIQPGPYGPYPGIIGSKEPHIGYLKRWQNSHCWEWWEGGVSRSNKI